MTQPSLLVICITAFVAVMVLLSVLAGLIRLLTSLFPHVPPAEVQSSGPGGAVLAAIHAAAAATFPGRRVTKIEEHR